MRKFLFQQSIPNILLILCFFVMTLALFSLVRERRENDRLRKDPKRAAIVEGSRNQELQKFNLTGFDEQGKRFWNLEGETAQIDPGQTVMLDQNVTLKMRDGTTIKTDHVTWSPSGGELTTDARVHVDHKNALINGVGAVGRPNDSFVQLNRDIDMKINETTTLTCKGPMKLLYKENKMVFYRDVKVTDSKGVLTANRMDVFFDANKKIQKIVALGKVEIDREGDTTKSKKAIYDVITGSVRLEGSPEVTFHKKSHSGGLDVPFGS